MKEASYILLLLLASVFMGYYSYTFFKTKALEESVAPLDQQSVLYEVKYSKEEATAWTYLTSMHFNVQPGQTIYKYIYWARPYESQLKLKVSATIVPGQYYDCHWYECRKCSLYSYTVCNQYKCTISKTKTVAVCGRTTITSWKCTKEETDDVTRLIVDIKATSIDWVYHDEITDLDGKPDWISIESVNSVDYESWINNLIKDVQTPQSEKINEYCTKTTYKTPKITDICLVVPPIKDKGLTNDVIRKLLLCLQDNNIYLDVFYNVNGQTYHQQVRWDFIYLDDYYWICVDKEDLQYSPNNIEKIWIDIPEECEKLLPDLVVWTGDYTIEDIYAAIDIWGSKKDVYNCGGVPKSVKQDLESEGYTCSPQDTMSETKTFEGTTDCSVVKFVSDPSKEDTDCSDGSCAWYCPPEYECTDLKTIDTKTVEEGTTYYGTKEELYEKGCSDAEISCISWGTKQGTYNDYLADKTKMDAKNPTCISWSSETYKSAEDETKTTGEPPFVKCTYKSQISKEQIEGAVCEGPRSDTVVQPLRISVKDKTLEFYKSGTQEIIVPVQANEYLELYVTGPTFKTLPQEGSTSLSISVYALEENPYVVSEKLENISVGGVKGLKYVAVIYSPADGIYAKFVPRVCADFIAQGLKYRFAKVDGDPSRVIGKDPCSSEGVILILHKGNNEFVLEGFSVNPEQFKTCIEKPNTCEEEDLYGCPEQCKLKEWRLICPSSLIIKEGMYEKTTIPIVIVSSKNKGFVTIKVTGQGVYYYPETKEIDIGTNSLKIEVTYTVLLKKTEKQTGKTLTWRVEVETPPSFGTTEVQPDMKYCEIKVTVMPKEYWDWLKRPELIFAAAIIVVAIILYVINLRRGE